MKKIGLICATALIGMSLTACGSQSTKKTSSSSKASSSKVVKHHKKANKHSEKKQESASSNSSSVASSSSQQSQSNGNGQLSQGEINRQRGYDPNGNPLLPGQDHAAGSNPDGSPDAWVQGQIDWAKQNGYLNPDGSETQKGIEADQEVERDSQPGMP
ncbi:hypothetical protein [Limosilactobacillus frumenti]|uniref:hypothetical protein n=1 Tax=Limosilactobacillus frumenti TaxID=104955 RepID=UPI001F412331|nr:hypothetical protein [Limosilactobacillus frumenti]